MAQVTPQATPNPQAFKFTIEGVTFDAPTSVGDASAAVGTPFEALFGIPGVASVFATANFVTVMKTPGSEWDQLIGPIQAVLAEKF
jgi:hypothetical protein